jgi:nucleotide-binding universal stress UspA family protein
MTGSIVCGVGGSESAKRAVRLARSLSSELGLRLVFVRVVEPSSPDEKISAVADRLSRLSECTTDVDCGADWLVDVGQAADRLVAAAVDERASFIVVGSGRPRWLLLGSISAELAQRAPCPVVVVPPGAEASADGHGDRHLATGAARPSRGGSYGSAMPYDPLMDWEGEGGAVLAADEETDSIQDHTDRPETDPNSRRSYSSCALRCHAAEADRWRADDRRAQAMSPG